MSSVQFTPVGCFNIEDEKLPSDIGIIIGHYKI